jgi:toluene monooxygenase system ferredoxin subunit
VSRKLVARLSELWVGEMAGVQVGNTPVVLVNLGGVVCAYEDRCPHRGFPLSRGRLGSGAIVCSAHEWTYDALTGRGINPRGVALRALPVSVDGEEVSVDVDDGEGERRDGPAISNADRVGPVLEAGDCADAVVAAIRRLNGDVEVLDRGAYLRVLVCGPCRVTRAAIEEELQRPFRLPVDLERLMPSFKGRLSITEEEVRWDLPRAVG